MHLTAVHRTRFRYPFPASESHNEVRLMPLDDASQRLLSFDLTVSPHTKVFEYDEPGGRVHHFGIRNGHSVLEITATAEVETLLDNPFDQLDMANSDFEFYQNGIDRQTYTEFIADSTFAKASTEAFAFAAAPLKSAQGNAARLLLGLNRAINQQFEYESGSTTVHTQVHEVFESRKGVCQDFAHVYLSCARALGIPSRYVSGYLYGGDQQVRGEWATHAWVESLLPNGTWLALDPTNNLLANDHYIRVHIGRDYSEITPTRGVYLGPLAEEMTVSVDVTQPTGAQSSSRSGSIQ